LFLAINNQQKILRLVQKLSLPACVVVQRTTQAFHMRNSFTSRHPATTLRTRLKSDSYVVIIVFGKNACENIDLSRQG